jgi:hypothetical protein
MSTQNEDTPTANKISTYLQLIVLIILALSFAALVFAANALMAGDNVGWFLGFIGFIAMALSIYLLTQNKRTVQMKIETPKVMTTIDCGKCGKTTREYNAETSCLKI